LRRSQRDGLGCLPKRERGGIWNRALIRSGEKSSGREAPQRKKVRGASSSGGGGSKTELDLYGRRKKKGVDRRIRIERRDLGDALGGTLGVPRRAKGTREHYVGEGLRKLQRLQVRMKAGESSKGAERKKAAGRRTIYNS